MRSKGSYKALILTFVLCSSSLLGSCSLSEEPECAVEEGTENTLDWYVNYSWFTADWGENSVSREISRITGTDIEFVTPSGSETEKLNALIAQDSLPDLVTLGWWEPQINSEDIGEYFYPLNELADMYCPEFYENAGKAQLDWYTKQDGNIYCYPNSSVSPSDYIESGEVSNQTFLVRKDIYEAIGSPDMTTEEGFASAVKAAEEMFPETDGGSLIPIGFHEFDDKGCDSLGAYLMNFLAVPYEKDGSFYDRQTDEEYIKWLKVFRRLCSEGYITSDVFTDKRIQMEEKILDGRYFCLFYQQTDIAEVQKQIYANDPERIYIAVDGPKNSSGDDHILPGGTINGWTVTLVSRNCSDPERAIKLISFLISEEGQRLTYLGCEGEDYSFDSSGKPVLSEKTAALLNSDYPGYVRRVGANNTYWMLQDKVIQRPWKTAFENPELMQLEEWTVPYTHYLGQYEITYAPDSEFAAADQKIKLLWGKTLPELLLADTEEEFDIIFDKYISERNAMGYERLIDESTVMMNSAKEKLGFGEQNNEK